MPTIAPISRPISQEPNAQPSSAHTIMAARAVASSRPDAVASECGEEAVEAAMRTGAYQRACNSQTHHLEPKTREVRHRCPTRSRTSRRRMLRAQALVLGLAVPPATHPRVGELHDLQQVDDVDRERERHERDRGHRGRLARKPLAAFAA